MSWLDKGNFNVDDYEEECKELGVQTFDDDEDIPTGVYQGHFFFMEERGTKRKGTLIRCGFKITEGEFAGKSVFSNLNVVCPGAKMVPKLDDNGVQLKNKEGKPAVKPNGQKRAEIGAKRIMAEMLKVVKLKAWDKDAVLETEMVLEVEASKGKDVKWPVNINFKKVRPVGDLKLADGDPAQIEEIKRSFLRGTTTADGEVVM